jgi:predicted DNA-binding transcriptional regulator AlpA
LPIRKIITTILQCSREDLRTEIKNCFRESIEEIKSFPPEPTLPDRITLSEACEITGLSKSQLYKMSMLNSIPRGHYGKKLIFSRKELTEFVKSRTVSALQVKDVMTDRLAKAVKNRRD